MSDPVQYTIMMKMSKALDCLAACTFICLATLQCAHKHIIPVSVAQVQSADLLLTKAGDLANVAQFEGANHFLAMACEIYKNEQRWASAIQCLIQMGNNWQKIGNLEQAKLQYNQALQLIKTQQGPDNLELAQSLQQLAFKMLFKKDYEKALELLNQALTIKQKNYGNNHPELSKIYNIMALIYWNKDDTQKAVEYSTKSIFSKLYKFHNIDANLLKNYSFLDGLIVVDDSFRDIPDSLDKSLSVYLETVGGKNPLVASLYEKTGMIYTLQGAHDQGLDCFRKAMKIWMEIAGEDDLHVASSCENIGIALRLRGDLDEALNFLNQALNIKKSGHNAIALASTYFQLGKVKYLQYRFSEAIEYYQKSLQALIPSFSAKNIYDNPDFEQVGAKENLLEILTAKTEALDMRYLVDSSQKDDLFAALQTIQAAVRLIDIMRIDFKAESYRLFFGEKIQKIYDLALQISVKLYKLTDDDVYKEYAFNFSEKSKAAVLSEALLESKAREFAGIPNALLEKEKNLKAELYQYETQIEKESKPNGLQDQQRSGEQKNRFFALQAEYYQLIASFEKNFPDYYKLKYKNEQIPISEFQKSIPEKTALIEYFLDTQDLTIFFVSRNKFEIMIKPIAADFPQIIETYCRAINKIDEKSFLSLSPQLYHVFIDPLQPLLKDIDRLLIIPDRILAYVPFETLIREKSEIADFSQLDFLIKHFSISYHFSGQLWLQQNQKPIPWRVKSLVGFAPVFSSDKQFGYIYQSTDEMQPVRKTSDNPRSITIDDLKFPELPGTEIELRSIISLFAEKHLDAVGFFHARASEEILKSASMKKYSIIHLATHTLKNDDNPKLSGFILAPPNETSREDGILYADEMYSLNLDCELLVLSSCESGIGKLVEGEGLLALTRGLFYAGARNIVYSLWKVEDKATSLLMVKLYQEILNEKNILEALRRAKLSFIRNPYTAFPKYWAGFIVLGG